jgi:hypothetical protein
MSIAKDLVLAIDTVSIDYRGMPGSPTWRIDPSSGLAASAAAGLLEVPIATFEMPLRARLEFLFRRARSIGKVRGSGISRTKHQSRRANLTTLVQANLRYLGGSPRFLLSADTKGFDVEMLLDGFDRYVRAHQGETVMASMIGHPKLMFEEQQQLFARFVEGARRRHGRRLRFAAARDAARLVSL